MAFKFSHPAAIAKPSTDINKRRQIWDDFRTDYKLEGQTSKDVQKLIKNIGAKYITDDLFPELEIHRIMVDGQKFKYVISAYWELISIQNMIRQVLKIASIELPSDEITNKALAYLRKICSEADVNELIRTQDAPSAPPAQRRGDITLKSVSLVISDWHKVSGAQLPRQFGTVSSVQTDQAIPADMPGSPAP